MRTSKPTVPRRAVIYARFSSSRQNERSIEEQIEDGEKWAADNGYEVVGTYGDFAKTGRNDNRPEFRRMVEDAKRGRFEYVIIWHTNRIHRNMINSFITLGALMEHGIKIRSVMQPELNDDSSSSVMLLYGIHAWKDEDYSKNLSDNVKRGMGKKAEKGLYLGYPKFGYDHDENDRFVLNEKEHEHSQFLYREIANNRPLISVAEEAERLGMRNKQGKPPSWNWIYRFVKDDFNIGVFRYGDTVIYDNHPKNVSIDLFEAANEALGHRRGKAGKMIYSLVPKLYCGSCGTLMHGYSGTARNGEKKRYYGCKGKWRCCAVGHGLRAEDLEATVCDAVRRAFADPDEVGNAVENLLAYQREHDYRPQLEAARMRLRDAEKEKESIADAIAGGCPYELLKDRAEGAMKELEYAKFELERIEQEGANLDASDFTAYFNAIAEGAVTDEQIATYFIGKAVVYQDKIVIVTNLSRADHSLMEIECALDGSNIYQMVGDGKAEKNRLIMVGSDLAIIVPLVA